MVTEQVRAECSLWKSQMNAFPGHIVQQCNLPQQDDSSLLSPTPLTPLDTLSIIETPTSSKRPHLETLSSIEEIPTNSHTDSKQPADRIPKKPRTSNIEEQLSPLKEHIETNASEYPLTYEELKYFYDNTRGSKDILSVARQYTEDIEGLVYMLSKIHQLFDNKRMKSGNTKIKKILMKNVNTDNITMNLTDTDSDLSSQETFLVNRHSSQLHYI
ncbi:hypothetical protein JTB14_033607 [Gonioctena quinquepunctata]|nr:hypothetical protein JTB14_033607 [Gonioctena quinquepunctata]